MSKEDFKEGYLKALAKNHRDSVFATTTPEEQLLMLSGARLNWVGEYINDESIHWTFQSLKVDDITLSGTGPEWDRIIRSQAEMNPAKLRELMQNPEIAKVFANATNNGLPILVRKDEGKLKVLDGMNRVIYAIGQGQEEIEAYVGEREGQSRALIEAHILYDFIRAYRQRRGSTQDFKGGLRFLVESYANAHDLLRVRFSEEWVHDEEISKIITEVLNPQNSNS